MIEISVKSNFEELMRTLPWMQPQEVRLAAAKALTFIAMSVRSAEREEMQQVFDRPTPFTLNSLYLQSANPGRLSARVWFKDLRFGPHYLVPQVEGGERRWKRFEQFLQAQGILPSGMYAVPGAGAKMDAFGNMDRGQIVQILSALQALPETGYLANRSRRKGARRNRATALIFAGQPHPGMPRGVWQRVGATGLRPLLVFVKSPHYRKLFDFYGVARKIVARDFEPQLRRALRHGAAAIALPMAA